MRNQLIERERERDKWAFEEKFVHTFRKKERKKERKLFWVHKNAFCKSYPIMGFGFIKMTFANHPRLWVLGS